MGNIIAEDEQKEVIQEFRVEIEQSIPILEKSLDTFKDFVVTPSDYSEYSNFIKGKDTGIYIEHIKSFNRVIHTIKGVSGFVPDFEKLNKYCHSLEELSSNLEKGSVILDSESYGIFCNSVIVLTMFIETMSLEGLKLDEDIQAIKECKARFDKEDLHIDLAPQKGTTITERETKVDIPVSVEDYEDLVDQFQSLSQYIVETFKDKGLAMGGLYGKLEDYVSSFAQVSQVSFDAAKYTRVVDGVSKTLNKKVAFTVTSNSASAHPAIWESYHRSLIHLVRNAVDHGIESPEERKKLGKPEEGKLEMAIFETHKHVYITLKDDGKGIDEDVVSRIALENGVINSEELVSMSSSEKKKLIFRSGFSTKESTTDISGRGIGMNVVQEEIENKLGGGIKIVSELNEGTSFSLRVPKNNSLSECLIFGNDEYTYAIHKDPSVQYFEYFPNKVKIINNKSVYVGLDEFFPFVDVFKMCKHTSENRIMVCIGTGKERYGLLVPQVRFHKQLTISRGAIVNGLVFGHSILGGVPLSVFDLDFLRNECFG